MEKEVHASTEIFDSVSDTPAIIPLSALAQQQMIKGQVVDDKGETIIGATVMVKGSKDGTLTDIDGNFSVKGK